jgi:hypothetical protein
VESSIAASRAAYEQGRGTGGFLIVPLRHCTSQRNGEYTGPDEAAYGYWQPRETYITQLERARMYIAVMVMAPLFQEERGASFIDNIAALMAPIRGQSANESWISSRMTPTPHCPPANRGCASNGYR